MTFLHNIRTVARYEATTLRRSWFFRLFSIGALFILTIFNIAMFSPVGDEDWELVSIPSSLPLINLFMLNIGQSIVVIFLAADFLKRDKKVDTNEVLYTRSMSNLEYIMGKTLGILRLFIGLDLIVLFIGLVINIISKNMSVDWWSYLQYLFIICVPTILFSLGLAFMLMSLIRNQAITFLILLGVAALDMFWLWYRFGSIFDYMAFGLPVFKSTIVGFDNPDLIINQRLLYLFLGLALVLATVILFKRLPQSKVHMTITYVFMILFTGGSVICAYNTWSLYRDNTRAKKLVIDTNRQFESRMAVSLQAADIELAHEGKTFKATAKLKLRNDNRGNLDNYIFSLNPGLNVIKVESSGTELSFRKTNHIIEVTPRSVMLPGATDSIAITYSGTIDESFIYPNHSDNPNESAYRIAMLNVNKRQSFLTDEFVLLIPEAHWYPVPGLNFYPDNPARIKVDFTKFTMKVRTSGGLMPVAQGAMKKTDDWYSFTPDEPLTGLTLAIGNYIPDTLKVDSLTYLAYHYPGHDYYRKDLSELKDTVKLMVSGIMRELETNFSTKYPFKTLSLVEVPVQFYSYPRMCTQTRAELQPSMVLLPEKLSTLQNTGFAKQFARQKKRMTRNNQVITDKELQVRLFNNFVRNTFISGENFTFRDGQAVNEPTRYRLGPSFYFFKNNFYSSEYPVINAVFETHLQKVAVPGQGNFAGMAGGLTDNDQANLILKEYSFRNILAKNPGSDTIRKVLTVKGDYLFNLFRSKAGIDQFKDWFAAYIDENKFRSVSVEKLNKDMSDKFGFEFYPFLNEWFNKKDQPGFDINNLQVTPIVVDNRTRYQVTFIAVNKESVAGLFNVSFRTGGPGGRGGGMGGRGPMAIDIEAGQAGRGNFSISMQGRGMEASDISKIVFIGPGEARRVGIVLDAQPRSMSVNTLFSRNIPGQLTIPVTDVAAKAKTGVRPFEGEEILASIPDFENPSEIIVDNEDPGFVINKLADASPLKKMLGVNQRRGNTYQQINNFWAPEYWQPVVQSAYYGKYILSAVYTRSGTGNKEAVWKTPVEKPGFYDVYFYVGKNIERMSVRGTRGGGPGGGGPGGGAPGGGGPQIEGPGGRFNEPPFKEMHLKIYHDEGIEELTFDYQAAEGGWNNIGRYYISSDTARVVLSNLSAGRIVIADAVKWVKQD